MTTCNFKLCDTFKISKLICFPRYSSENSHSFKLIKTDSRKQYKFTSLIPDSDSYLYIKIDNRDKIVALEGGYVKRYKIKRKRFLNKKLSEIEFCEDFLLNYIKPLHEKSIKDGLAYQFLFTSTCHEKTHVCSIYPCSVPGSVSSTDVVIREPVEVFNSEELESFILQTTRSGELVPKLH